MKKEAFKNILLRFLRKCKITYTTTQINGVLITGRYLRGLHIVPDRTRCAVTNIKMRDDFMSMDFLVEYSIEVFLYKLFRHSIISELTYRDLLRLWLVKK